VLLAFVFPLFVVAAARPVAMRSAVGGGASERTAAQLSLNQP